MRDVVKTDAEAFYVVDIACRNTVEFLENVLLVFFGDADTVVGNFEDGKAWFGAGGDGDMGFLYRVFDGIVDKVVQHVGNVQVVGIERAVNVAKVGLDSAVAVLKGELEVLYGREYEAVEVNLLRIEGEVLSRHLGTLQQCFN